MGAKHAFVTGATGFLGLNVVSELAARGWTISALHRPSSDLRYLRRFPVSLVEGRLEDASDLVPEGTDVVFHVGADLNAWTPNNDRQTRCNVEGTRALLASARRRGVARFLYTSSINVYGFNATPVDETAPKKGAASWINYTRTKAIAEDLVAEAVAGGLDAAILTPGGIMGRFDTRTWGRLFTLASSRRLPFAPPGRASFCDAAEVARVHVEAVTRARTGESYLLGGADAAYTEVVATIEEILGLPRTARRVPPLVFRFAGFVCGLLSRLTGREPEATPEKTTLLSESMLCSSDKAVRELGYRPVPLRAILESCHRWLCDEGLLAT